MIIGDKVNHLTYKENLGKINSKYDNSGVFVCDCGNEVIKLLGSVRSGGCKCCGKSCPFKIHKRVKFLHKKDDKYLCTKCGEYKDGNEFDESNTKSSIHRDYKDRRCKECKSIQSKWNNKFDDIDRMLNNRFLGLQERSYKNSIDINITKDYLKELWVNQKGFCALSGIKMTHIAGNGRTFTNVSIDRIDSNLGYVEGNVQLVCMAANQMKSDLNESELLKFCKAIIENYENRNNRNS